MTVGQFDDDESYITKIRHKVNLALSSFAPDFVIYNAGYDIMEGDHYGKMKISESILMLRDELIFREVIEDQGVPILMTIGGCYQRRVETVIARSIRNIIIKMDLSPKRLQASSAQNLKYSRKLQGKFSRYESEELGFAKNSSKAMGTSRSSVRFQPATRDSMSKFNDGNVAVNTADEKYNQIYDELKEGLYDRNSVGTIDMFSKRR